jgi:hypothetical protein
MKTRRQVGGAVVLLALLALFASAASASSQADTDAPADLQLAPPSATDGHAELAPHPEHVEPCADGTIDSWEDDDSGHGQLACSCTERTESPIGASPSVERPKSDVVPRSYLARGPPFT